jgi:hypothetical protein
MKKNKNERNEGMWQLAIMYTRTTDNFRVFIDGQEWREGRLFWEMQTACTILKKVWYFQFWIFRVFCFIYFWSFPFNYVKWRDMMH